MRSSTCSASPTPRGARTSAAARPRAGWADRASPSSSWRSAAAGAASQPPARSGTGSRRASGRRWRRACSRPSSSSAAAVAPWPADPRGRSFARAEATAVGRCWRPPCGLRSRRGSARRSGLRASAACAASLLSPSWCRWTSRCTLPAGGRTRSEGKPTLASGRDWSTRCAATASRATGPCGRRTCLGCPPTLRLASGRAYGSRGRLPRSSCRATTTTTTTTRRRRALRARRSARESTHPTAHARQSSSVLLRLAGTIV
mmetsp:Transcript_47882/g.159574  ORF Transcript_47882/g.159574 Transcript_47882/m.159574 type:complete len:259 (-) Transcript_47882:43-819(-)